MAGRSALTGLARRAGWSLADQMLSSLTNVLLTFLVASAVDPRGFGAFSVAFLVFALTVGVQRALVGQPWSIRLGTTPADEQPAAVAAGSSTGLALGVLVGALTAVTGLAVGGLLGPTLLVTGLLMPGLLLQDTCRMAFFAQRRPHLAAANDALWLVLQVVAMGVLLLQDVTVPYAYVAAWGGSATVCAAVGLLQLRVRPRPGLVRRWLSTQRDLTGYLVAEFVLGTGAYHGGVLLVGSIVGLADVGSMRAAQVLLGPLGVLALAANSFLLPEYSRRTPTAPGLWRLALSVSGFMGLASAAFTAVLLLLPDAVGERLLGDTWTGARSVLLPLAVASTLLGIANGPSLTIYTLGLARITFRVHLLEGPLVLLGLLVGARLGGVEGAAWGTVIATGSVQPVWWLTLRHLLSRHAVGKADVVTPDER